MASISSVILHEDEFCDLSVFNLIRLLCRCPIGVWITSVQNLAVHVYITHNLLAKCD